MALYETPARLLDTFIMNNLQPDERFLSQVRTAVNIICDFLKTNCFKNSGSKTKVIKVVKGGSSAKGTALKNGSDADLVVFLNCFNNYKDQNANRKEILNEVTAMLKKCQEEKRFDVDIVPNKWPNPRVLSFSIKSKELYESIEMDVLPAFDALGTAKIKEGLWG
ncbi:2'-5'-oligoadenylate synthase 3-like [Protopterus annectens]|uniref:2'-5'-oligoadenylate synthase 3-like n=1 Tax=Protopterus annectens TaxID=7888 RepID=UPI001CF93C7B|nr:2'-5'-oligoadenylate synthase 3-like [Protopterus annectens]